MNLAVPMIATPDATRPKLTLNWRGKTPAVPDITFYDVTENSPPPALPARHVVNVQAVDEMSPLQICMNHWRDWMQHSDRDLGSRGQTGIASGDGEHEGYDDGAAASEAAAARASRDIAMATDAMIDSLPRHFKAAIYRVNNISTQWSVWRLPNLDFDAVLPEAEKELSEKLSKNIATRAFF